MRSRVVTIGLKVLSVTRTLVLSVVPLRLRAVKAVIRSPDGRALVVRHSYGSGDWLFPGGLVHRGESCAVAVRREVHEELGVDIRDWTELAEFSQRIGLTRQRLFLLTAVVDETALVTNDEIAATLFVDPTRPPQDISPATLRRLTELAAGQMPGGDW